MKTSPNVRSPDPNQVRCSTDEAIIEKNLSHILANPTKLYEHEKGRLDAVAVLEIGISERLETIQQHRTFYGRRANDWSREVVAELQRDIRLMGEAIRRLAALGVTTASPLALALRRERERPLPTMRDLLAPAVQMYAASKSRRPAAILLDTETPVKGVTCGKVRDELKIIAVPTVMRGAQFDLKLTAGWGHAGQNGVTMPGKGKVESRAYAAEEMPTPEALPQLGPSTCDVYLNDTACWKNVPVHVWEYTIGGYQVMKKWLSYREHELLGRALTADEAREVTHVARRIAALLLLQPALDANYEAVKNATHPWPASTAAGRRPGH